MALKKFSEVAKDGCCPKCGCAVMKRDVNAVTGNLAVGLATGLATGGLLGPARKTIKCGGCGTKYLQGSDLRKLMMIKAATWENAIEAVAEAC